MTDVRSRLDFDDSEYYTPAVPCDCDACIERDIERWMGRNAPCEAVATMDEPGDYEPTWDEQDATDREWDEYLMSEDFVREYVR